MGITNKKLISQYKEIHKTQKYGFTSFNLSQDIIPSIVELEAMSVLDYGCGQSLLYQRMQINNEILIERYDPSIVEISTVPTRTFDLVINTDVLEHIPEKDITDVIGHIQSLGKHCYFNIHTGPAKVILPSGENAHCTIKEPDWWLEKIQEFFPDARITEVEGRHCTIKSWPDSKKHLIKRFFYKVREKLAKKKMKLLKK